ncbi:TIGR03016 family PEP-CTERM system-associated outer membrane protein [Zoogloea sp.]|uniref:TIGR03016 family PEP-CTERM system-associated outer membrane protein n=1 Tax=Zoogloea sp. TaxID=49181 RepID=UPI0035B2C8FF
MIAPVSTRSRQPGAWRLAALCAPIGLVAAAPALAQQQTLKVTPSIRLTETITDNAGLRRDGQGQSDWITQISPGVSIDARGSRVTGALSVSANANHYANGSLADSTNMALSGKGKITAWENRLYVDLTGSVTRMATSVFGARPADSVTGANQTQVSVFNVSPYFTTRFGETGSVQLRYTLGVSDSGSSAMARSTAQTWMLDASDPRMTGFLGWGFNLLDRTNDNAASSRVLKQQTARFTGMAQVAPDFMLRAIVGSESNNYRISNRSSSIYGMGADWTPTPRTRVTATVEDRFFGTGYSLSADHRSSRMAYRIGYSKDASTTSGAMLGALSLYDLLMLQYTARYPDFAERDAYVRQLIESQAPGMGNVIVGAQSVLTNSTFLDKRLQIGATYVGPRDSLGLVLFQSERDSLVDRDYAVGNDLQTGSQLRTTGASLTFSHRVTEQTNFNASLTSTRSRNQGSLTQSSDSRLLTAGLTSRLTPKATGSLNARRNEGSATTGDYSENALIGSLAIQF